MPDNLAPVRFTEVLTMATSVAAYLGESVIEARHVVLALDVLQGSRTLESLGRPVSPLARRPAGGPAVHPDLASLVQAWWNALGSDPRAELDAGRLPAFLATLAGEESPP